MFTSRVYILSPLAPQTRKAKGPAFLFVCCLEADGKTGLRIKGEIQIALTTAQTRNRALRKKNKNKKNAAL